jgi:hypothetical protein
MCEGSDRDAKRARQAKVGELERVGAAVDEQVLGLEVAVQHAVRVAVGHALEHLEQVRLHAARQGQSGHGSTPEGRRATRGKWQRGRCPSWRSPEGSNSGKSLGNLPQTSSQGCEPVEDHAGAAPGHTVKIHALQSRCEWTAYSDVPPAQGVSLQALTGAVF